MASDSDDDGMRGAGRLPMRFLIGVDERASIPDLAAYVGTVGSNGRVIARVVHVIELLGRPGGLAIKSVEEASDLVDEASFLLRMNGIGADGMVRHGRPNRTGLVLLEEATNWRADAVVLLARRSGAWRRFLGPGVREQVLRESRITTVLVSRQTFFPRQHGRDTRLARGR
jgi:nucleotide-binding universal stress UspA family protein